MVLENASDGNIKKQVGKREKIALKKVKLP